VAVWLTALRIDILNHASKRSGASVIATFGVASDRRKRIEEVL